VISLAIPLHSEWRFEMPSTLESIEGICSRFQTWRALHCAGLGAFPSEMLLREALANAVDHGANGSHNRNRGVVQGVVRSTFRAGRGSLFMVIHDEGKGFDWRAAWNRQAGPEAEGGRGIEILRRYASFVRFNTKGNTVMLLQRF
jgi:hypothetical protein